MSQFYIFFKKFIENFKFWKDSGPPLQDDVPLLLPGGRPHHREPPRWASWPHTLPFPFFERSPGLATWSSWSSMHPRVLEILTFLTPPPCQSPLATCPPTRISPPQWDLSAEAINVLNSKPCLHIAGWLGGDVRTRFFDVVSLVCTLA